MGQSEIFETKSGNEIAVVQHFSLKGKVVMAMAKSNLLQRLLLCGIVFGCVVWAFVDAPRIGAQSPPTTAAPLPSFEVVSIKPNHSGDMRTGVRFQPGRFTTSGSTAKRLITIAYDVRDFQISGGPSWITSDRYDIDAKEPDGFAEELMKLPPDADRRAKMDSLIQSLLADRFKLKVSHATKELPVYALVIAKGGPKIQEVKPGDTYPEGFKGPHGRAVAGGSLSSSGKGQLTGQEIAVAFLAQNLSEQLGRTVVDQTGLKGNYDFTLKWTPDPGPAALAQVEPGSGSGPDNAPPPDSSGPSIFTALQEQLGLELVSTKGPVDILVIDHIEMPSAN